MDLKPENVQDHGPDREYVDRKFWTTDWTMIIRASMVQEYLNGLILALTFAARRH